MSTGTCNEKRKNAWKKENKMFEVLVHLPCVRESLLSLNVAHKKYIPSQHILLSMNKMVLSTVYCSA